MNSPMFTNPFKGGAFPRQPSVISMLTLSLLMVMLISASQVQAATAGAVPDRLSFQGYIEDGGGIPLGDSIPANYEVVFRIYNQATGGNLLWSEKQTVTFDKGNYSVLLGQGSDVPQENRPNLSTVITDTLGELLYVQTTVLDINGVDATILPRLRLLPTPYSFLAKRALTADGEGITSGLNGSAIVANSIPDDRLSSNIRFGSITDNRLSPNVAFRNVQNTFAAQQTFNGPVVVGNSPGNVSSVVPPVTVNPASAIWFGLNNAGGTTKWHIQDTVGGIDFVETGVAQGRVFLKPGGNVGIGTTNPDEKIHVNGNAFVNGRIKVQGANVIEFGSGIGGKEASAGTIGYGAYKANHLDIVGAGNNSTDRKIQIWAEGGTQFNGEVGIGFANPDNWFAVQGPNTGRFSVYDFSGGEGDAQLVGGWKGTVGPQERYERHSGGTYWDVGMKAGDFVIEASDTPELKINSLGEFGLRGDPITGYGLAVREGASGGVTSWLNFSDSRLKKEILQLTNALSIVTQLRGVSYEWDENEESGLIFGEGRELGFIAQEVQKVLPQVVVENGNGYLSMAYSKVVPVLVEAIKEQQIQMDEKESKIVALEKRLAALEAKEKERSDKLAALESLVRENLRATENSALQAVNTLGNN